MNVRSWPKTDIRISLGQDQSALSFGYGMIMLPGPCDMATWLEEFTRLSDIEREEIEKWKTGENNSNMVIDVAEAIKAFLINYLRAGSPSRNQEMT